FVTTSSNQLNAVTTAAFEIVSASGTGGLTSSLVCLRIVREPQAGERHTGKADTEFFQRSPARDRLGQALGEFIEFVVHFFLPIGCFELWDGPSLRDSSTLSASRARRQFPRKERRGPKATGWQRLTGQQRLPLRLHLRIGLFLL